MKSLAMKFAGILLAAVLLLTAIGSVLGMVFASALEAEGQTPDEILYEELRYEARAVAYAQVRAYLTYQNSPAHKEVVDHAVNCGLVDVYNVPLGYNLQAVGWIITDPSGQSHSEGDMLLKEARYGFYFEAIAPSYDIVVPSDQVTEPKKESFGYGGISYSVLRRDGQMHSVEVMLEMDIVEM